MEENIKNNNTRLKIFLFSLLFILTICLLVYWQLSRIAAGYAERLLHNHGFPEASIGKLSIGGDGTIIHDLYLTDEKQIEYLELRYNGFQQLLSKRPVEQIIIDKAKLTLTTGKDTHPSSTDQQLSIAKAVIGLVPLPLPFKQIELRQLNLNLNLPDYKSEGGLSRSLSLRVDGAITQNERLNGIRFNTNIHAAEPDVSFETAVSGEITNAGILDILFEIKNGKIALPEFNVKRLSGWASLYHSPETGIVSSVEMNAGTIQAMQIPFYDVTLTYVGDPEDGHEILGRSEARNGSANFLLDMTAKPTGQMMDMSGKLDITARDLSSLNSLPQFKDVDIKGKGSININFDAQKDITTAAEQLTGWTRLNSGIAVNIQDMALPGLVEELNTQMQISAHKAEDGFQAKVKPGANIEADGQKLSFKNAIDLKVTPGSTLAETTVQLIAKDGKYSKPDIDFALSDIDLDLRYDKILKGALVMNRVKYDPWLVPLKVTTDFQSDDDFKKLDINSEITEKNGLFYADFKGAHDILDNGGDGIFTIYPINFKPGIVNPHDIFPVAKEYMQETEGTVGATSKITWGKSETGEFGWNGHAEVLVKNLSSVIQENGVANINSVITVENLRPLSIREQSIAISGLDVGIPLTNGIITFSLRDINKNLDIHKTEWSFAGGRVYTQPFTIDLASMSGKFNLEADTLDLREIFQLAPLEGLSAQGTVEGAIPVVLKNGKISIKDGSLSSVKNGNVRYDPEKMPAFLRSQTDENIINLRTALQNFEFEWLELKMDGDVGGEQKIHLKAKGKNPTFYDGFPVEINLNLEGAIESVLRTNLNRSSIPDAVKKKIEAYETKNAK